MRGLGARIGPWLWAAAVAAGPAAAEDRLVLPEMEVEPGDPSVQVPIAAANDAPLHGFSIAFSWAGAPAELIGLGVEGTEVEAVEPDFVEPIVDAGRREAILAVIVELTPPFRMRAIAPAQAARPIAVARFAVPVRAAPGRHPLRFADGIGSPPIWNTFSSAGRSTHPALEDGALIVRNPNHLRVGSAEIRAGGRGAVLVRAEHPDPLEGYQVAVVYPSDAMRLESIDVDGLDVERLVGPRGREGGIEFLHARIDEDAAPGLGWGGLGVEFDALEPFRGQTLPAGEGQAIARLRFRVDDGAVPGRRLAVEPRDGLGDPPLESAFLSGGVSFHPEAEQGEVLVLEPARFVRGDSNGDGSINIADPIHMLGAIFAGGDADCRDAMDANDDGAVDVADPIYLLAYIFLGELPPPPPFPEEGVDPTEDELDCAR